MRLSRLACLIALIEVGCNEPIDIDKPGPPLDYAKCQTVWALASPTGAALSFGKAAPYVLDFTVIDVGGMEKSRRRSSEALAMAAG
jgi:hypothetical protein